MSGNDRFFKGPPMAHVMARPGGATGIPVARPNRNVGIQPTPNADFSQAITNYDAFTYTTKVGPQPQGGAWVLYNGDRAWTEITLTLQTAGPVAIGKVAELFPVLSGRGMVLTTALPVELTIAKGDRLYIAATAVNLVSVQIRAFPWLEQIAGSIQRR